MGKLKHTTAELDAGQLNVMWQFLQMGKHEAHKQDVQVLKANLDSVRQLLIQKSEHHRVRGDAVVLERRAGQAGGDA